MVNLSARLALVVGIYSFAGFYSLMGQESAHLRNVHGEIRCKLGEAWFDRDFWSGPVPMYVFVRPDIGPRMPTISIEKYPKGNKLYPSAKDFIATMTNGDQTRLGQARKAERRGKIRVMDSELTVWEREVKATEGGADGKTAGIVLLRERVVIFEQSDVFFILRLRSPIDLWRLVEKDYTNFAASFIRLRH